MQSFITICLIFSLYLHLETKFYWLERFMFRKEGIYFVYKIEKETNWSSKSSRRIITWSNWFKK